jgi:hypothetical protein
MKDWGNQMSNIKNTGGPAFPGVEYKQPGGVGASVMTIVGGMTLRDYFAAKALATPYAQHESNPDAAAEWAYQLADALLSARSTEKAREQ